MGMAATVCDFTRCAGFGGMEGERQLFGVCGAGSGRSTAGDDVVVTSLKSGCEWEVC